MDEEGATSRRHFSRVQALLLIQRRSSVKAIGGTKSLGEAEKSWRQLKTSFNPLVRNALQRTKPKPGNRYHPLVDSISRPCFAEQSSHGAPGTKQFVERISLPDRMIAKRKLLIQLISRLRAIKWNIERKVATLSVRRGGWMWVTYLLSDALHALLQLHRAISLRDEELVLDNARLLFARLSRVSRVTYFRYFDRILMDEWVMSDVRVLNASFVVWFKKKKKLWRRACGGEGGWGVSLFRGNRLHVATFVWLLVNLWNLLWCHWGWLPSKSLPT